MTKYQSSISSEFYQTGNKESRENMHDTSNAASMQDADAHYKKYRTCVSDFADIISTTTEPYDILGEKRLTGEDVHKAFMEAIKSQQDWHHAELNVLDELSRLSSGNREVYLD